MADAHILDPNELAPDRKADAGQAEATQAEAGQADGAPAADAAGPHDGSAEILDAIPKNILLDALTAGTVRPRRRVGQWFMPSRRERAAWLVTFSDLVALLVTFFVLLLSMSTIDPQAWAALSGKQTSNGASEQAPAVREGSSSPFAGQRDGAERAQATARYLASVLRSHVGRLEATGAAQAGTAALLKLDTSGERSIVRLPARLVATDAGADALIISLRRIVAAAPGRVTVLAPIVGGDTADWQRALASVPRSVSGVAIGAAGWVAPGELAIVIREHDARGEGVRG